MKEGDISYLVNGVHDPIDTAVAANGFVLRIDEDDLEVLVGGVLVDPVGVEHSQVGAAAADALFGGGFEGALVFQLVYALVGWFACSRGNTNQPFDCSHLIDDCYRRVNVWM